MNEERAAESTAVLSSFSFFSSLQIFKSGNAKGKAASRGLTSEMDLRGLSVVFW